MLFCHLRQIFLQAIGISDRIRKVLMFSDNPYMEPALRFEMGKNIATWQYIADL